MTAESNESNEGGRLQAVKGMYDLLPPLSRRFRAVEEQFHRVLRAYGYNPVLIPCVEYTHLFARSIGGDTDIVEKEMYTFDDRDGRSLTLRPEGTAGAVRAYVEHAVHKDEPVTQWYYLGPMFRHERGQRGRYRQFYQLGVEALGAVGPGVDAEMIALLVSLVRAAGLSQVKLHLNTLGCPECRPAYREALLSYLTPHAGALCPDCQRRFEQNPLRVLDCKVEGCQAIADAAPTSLDMACTGCREHWEGLTSHLSDLELSFTVDHRLVRGLDYYTRTTFELKSDEGGLGSQNTVAGGGRYDGLVEALGGPPTPAIGFAMGIERLLLALGDDRPALGPSAEVALVSRGEAAQRKALRLAEELRLAGVSATLDHRAGSIKSQMKRANRIGCRLVLILGEDELARDAVTLRRMASSEQEEVALASLVERVRDELQREGASHDRQQ